MNRTEALKIICDQSRQGELIFPTGLDVSLKILRVLDDPDCHIDQAAKLILGEPLLSARIVAVANSTTIRLLAKPCAPTAANTSLRLASMTCW